MTSSYSFTMSLSVTPSLALIDDRLVIKIKVAPPKQYITVCIHTKSDRGVKFASYGCFRTSDEGCVDISKDECLQGTYTGIDAMGLFWSMQPEPGFETKRFMKDNVSTPLLSTVNVYSGLRTLNEIQNGKVRLIFTSEVPRWYKAPNVKKIEIERGRIRGTLFIPSGLGPFPAVIDLFGGTGGLKEFKASLLASRGFLTLSLAFMAYKDLPDTPEHLVSVEVLDYFKEAIDWLASHPLSLKGGIGVIGVSLGAIYSNGLTLISDKVKASVQINGSPYFVIPKSYQMDTESKEAKLDYSGGYYDRITRTEEGSILKGMFNHNEDLFAKSWETNAKYLIICGDDDQCYDPRNMEKWYLHWPESQRHRIQFIKYKDAGHLIEPPYSPLNRVTPVLYPVKTMCVWGGRPKAHAFAQEDSWKRIQNFLRENLVNSSIESSKL